VAAAPALPDYDAASREVSMPPAENRGRRRKTGPAPRSSAACASALRTLSAAPSAQLDAPLLTVHHEGAMDRIRLASLLRQLYNVMRTHTY